MFGTQKENANPTIHSIENHTKRNRHHIPIGTNEVERYNFIDFENSVNKPNDIHDYDEEEEGNVFGDNVTEMFFRSSTERSVHLALSSSVSTTKNENGNSMNIDHVKLLRDAGFVLPEPSTDRTTVPRVLSEAAFGPNQHSIFRVKEDNKNGCGRRRRDVIDSNEVFDVIRNIQDPEHPLTLEQLRVVRLDHVEVFDCESVDGSDGGDDERKTTKLSTVDVRFTPTIPHCSMATLIGLCIRVKLLRSLPKHRFKVKVRINPGTHASEHAINRQLDDKERVCAALENDHLCNVVNKCIEEGMSR